MIDREQGHVCPEDGECPCLWLLCSATVFDGEPCTDRLSQQLKEARMKIQYLGQEEVRYENVVNVGQAGRWRQARQRIGDWNRDDQDYDELLR